MWGWARNQAKMKEKSFLVICSKKELLPCLCLICFPSTPLNEANFHFQVLLPDSTLGRRKQRSFSPCHFLPLSKILKIKKKRKKLNSDICFILNIWNNEFLKISFKKVSLWVPKHEGGLLAEDQGNNKAVAYGLGWAWRDARLTILNIFWGRLGLSVDVELAGIYSYLSPRGKGWRGAREGTEKRRVFSIPQQGAWDKIVFLFPSWNLALMHVASGKFSFVSYSSRKSQMVLEKHSLWVLWHPKRSC